MLQQSSAIMDYLTPPRKKKEEGPAMVGHYGLPHPTPWKNRRKGLLRTPMHSFCSFKFTEK
jgi:hypothetical protein